LRESGFAALVGRPCGLRELLAAGDGARAAAREAYAASVRKQIGASFAVLGGIDALAFCAAEPLACAGFVRETCAALGRLAVPWAGWEAGLAELPPQVHVLPFDRYEALAQLAAACP